MPLLSQPARARLLKTLRVIHAWLGIFVLPWILIIGATGFYLNHHQGITAFLDGADYDESLFYSHSAAQFTDYQAAFALAETIWPGEQIEDSRDEPYHGHDAFQFAKPSGRIIVTQGTGHYFVKTRTSRLTYAPDGTLLDRHIYWGPMLKQLHTDGWLGGSLGTWLADITALAMLVFGLTGIVLWWVPRAAKFKRALFGRGRQSARKTA